MEITKSALVLIDLQKESNFEIEGLSSIVENTRKLIEVCREKEIPVIYTRQVNREDGIGLSNGEPVNERKQPLAYLSTDEAVEIIDDIKPIKDDIVIDKQRWSAFYGTNLDLILKSLGIKHLIMGGLVTDGCLMTSVFDAYFRDYQVNLIKDICGATNSGAHMASTLIMANWIYDIQVFDTSEMIKKLDGEAFHMWKPSTPDQLQFTPETMREVFNQLNT